MAKKYGATDIINYKYGTLKQIPDATNGEGVDAVIVFGGGPNILIDALNIAKSGTVISNNNYFSSGRKEDILPISCVGWGYGMAYKTIISGLCPGWRVRMEILRDMVTYGRIDLSLMATHVFKGLDKNRRSFSTNDRKTSKPDKTSSSLGISTKNLNNMIFLK